MSLYEVICKLIRAGNSFNINSDRGNIIVTVEDYSNTFTSEDFHKAAQWMHDSAFVTATGVKEDA